MMSANQTRRIVLVSNTVMHYRIPVYNYFCRHFRQDGWAFEVLTNEIQTGNVGQPLFPIEVLPFVFKQYKAAIRARRPDAVILFLHLKDRIFWPLLHWLKWRRIPVILWTKTRNFDKPLNALSQRLFDYAMRVADGLVLYTEDLMRYVPAKHRRKAFPANNTLNFEQFPTISESKTALRQQLGIPFGKVVLFVGRMAEGSGRKRVDHLIEVFRDVGGRDAGLVIVGSGMNDRWRARMNPQTTLHLGEVHDPANLQISRIFAAADVCAIPGHVGLGLNQAFHFGLPVVAEHGCHPPEIRYLKPGRNGYLVPENDLAALKQHLFALLDDDALRAEFSSNARADIQREASIAGMYRGFLACAEHTIGNTAFTDVNACRDPKPSEHSLPCD